MDGFQAQLRGCRRWRKELIGGYVLNLALMYNRGTWMISSILRRRNWRDTC
jgi:hypothetical protein